MRILVTGKDGQLGQSIKNLVANTDQASGFVFIGKEELDLSDRNSIVSYFDNNDKFDVIVNCAAYTAVDKAEEEQDLANQINNLAVKQIAEIAFKQKTQLIHISTDYVFDGDSDHPYIETDATNPINIYGETKLAGEKSIQETMPFSAIIIRTSWMYSEYGNNFVKTMLRLRKERDNIGVVSDQVGSPTYASDLAKVIIKIINTSVYLYNSQPTEIYHYANEGSCSWYEFAKKIFNLLDTAGKCKLYPIETLQSFRKAKRPKDTVMSKHKVRDVFGINIPNWESSLEFCLKNIQNFKQKD